MTTLGTVDYSVDETVATVTLNRPEKKNAITLPMWEQLRDTLNSLSRRTDVTAVILQARGEDFCAGADLWTRVSDEPPPHESVSMRILTETAQALHTLPQPSVAAVRGLAVGAGCNLALGCDFVIAARSSRFCEIFTKRGLSPDLAGSWLLPRLVGLRRAKEIALLGDYVSAVEAEHLGLINRAVDEDELDYAVADLARRLATGPPIANAHTKQMLNAAFESDLTYALNQESAVQAMNFRTADARAAMKAFRDRTFAEFSGR